MPRQSKCTPERVEIICKIIADGGTDIEAARNAKISKDTFYTWLKEKPDFADAVKNARKRFEEWEMNGILGDAKKSLKTLILGQDYEEIKTEYEPGKSGQPQIRKQTITKKRIPPNATAIIFALCNRDPDNWSNRHINEIEGKIQTESKPGVSLANVPDDLLGQIIDIINTK